MFSNETTVRQFLRDATKRPDGWAAYIVSVFSAIVLVTLWFSAEQESGRYAVVANRWQWVLLFMPLIAFSSYGYLNYYMIKTSGPVQKIFNAACILGVGLFPIYQVLKSIL